MASTPSRKRTRSRAATRERGQNNAHITEHYLVDAHGKRVAVVLGLDEYRELVQSRRAIAPSQSLAQWDWLAAARDLRARTAISPDSTPLLRATRETRARREPRSA